MTRREREIWLVDQAMNNRGLPVDQKLLTCLVEVTFEEMIRLNGEIHLLTQGAVHGSTQNQRLLSWLQVNGYPLETLEREALTEFIGSPRFHALDATVRGVLELRAEASKTSTAKLKSIAAFSKTDDFARNLTQYGGAVRTLRWSGRGPQIQNFPRPIVKHVDEAIEQILLGINGDGLRTLFGKPLDVVSSCLRGVFKATPGNSFVICDYHAIEAIVLAWLAEDEKLLDVFRRGDDVYVATAAGVGSTSRTLGKVLRLACGYGMGHVKFQSTANAAPYFLNLTIAQALDAVTKFRSANGPIVSLWHGVENMAKRAIMNPSDVFTYRKLTLRMASDVGRLRGALLMTLPSGRNLVYRNARLEMGRIVFWGVHQVTKQWSEQDTYGGKLVENATQAIARDLLADAIVDLDRHWPNTLCTTVHDEIVAMVDDEKADALLVAMKEVMSLPPLWGAGLPLSCNGAVAKRYGKI